MSVPKKAPETVDTPAPATPGAIDAALAASTELQAQAKQLLERVAAEQAAKADEPSGVSVVVDWNFINRDPSDPAPHLSSRGIEERKDHDYGWVSTDSRLADRRRAAGWEPVAGGSVRRGDTVLSSRPKAIGAAIEARQAEQTRIMRDAPMRSIDQDGVKAGVRTFEGSGSRKEGM